METTKKIKEIKSSDPDAKKDSIENIEIAFINPPTFNAEELLDNGKYFIEGYKGTGKTALLLHLICWLKRVSIIRHLNLSLEILKEKQIRYYILWNRQRK